MAYMNAGNLKINNNIKNEENKTMRTIVKTTEIKGLNEFANISGVHNFLASHIKSQGRHYIAQDILDRDLETIKKLLFQFSFNKTQENLIKTFIMDLHDSICLSTIVTLASNDGLREALDDLNAYNRGIKIIEEDLGLDPNVVKEMFLDMLKKEVVTPNNLDEKIEKFIDTMSKLNKKGE